MSGPFDPLQPNAADALKSPSSSLEPAPIPTENSKLENIVFSPLRPDLIFQKQEFKNEEYYVIKDPLSLNYFRLQPEETFLISLLDGKRTFKNILETFSEEFPNAERTPKDVAAFFNQLGQAGLLNISAQGFAAMTKAKPKQGNFLFMMWVKVISKLLFFKVPLHDPSAWLGDFVKKMSFLWSRPFVGACIAFFIFTLIRLFGLHWEELSNTIPRFFVPSNIFLIWISMIIIKTFHEFGHAMTCRYFGGEVHEMGICMICFFLCGYVDASDAWMMRRHRYKIYTTIAGIFTEFIIASILANIWLVLSDGLIRDLVFNGMMVASINTVMFNMNPLMKFDGYYVISDWLQIPNLRSKAIAYCSLHLQRLLLAYRNTLQEKAVMHEEHGKVFIIYALASYVYMTFIIYSLSQIFAHFLEPYGLKQFGLIIGVAAQGTFLMLPIFRTIYDAFRPGAHIMRLEPLWRRLSKWGAAFTVLVFLFFALPTHYKIPALAILNPDRVEQVSSIAGGVLDTVLIKTGEYVERGDLLGILRNEAVAAQLEEAKAERKISELFINARRDTKDFTLNQQLPAALAKQESAYAHYLLAKQKVASLELKATENGIVLTPDAERLAGHYFSAKEPIFQIGDLENPLLLIPLTEDQVQLVDIGARLRGKWLGNGKNFRAQILRIYPQKIEENSYYPAVLDKFGGPLKDAMNDPKAIEKVGLFYAEAQFLTAVPTNLVPQMRMKVEIDGERTTFAKKAWRSFLNFWNLKGPAKNPFAQGKLESGQAGS